MPGTDLFFQYAEDADRKVKEREAQDRLKAEVINDDRARRMKAGGPTEDPPPPAPTEEPAGVRGYPLRYKTQLDVTGVVDIMGAGDPMGGEQIEDQLDLSQLAPSHVLSKDTIPQSIVKGVKQTGGQVLQGVGGLVRGAAENAGVDVSLGAAYGAVDKMGLSNPGLTAYMDTVKKLKSAIGLDVPLDRMAEVGTGIGKKGEEIVKANLSAAGTDYFQQQMQNSVSSVGLSVSALGLSFLTKNPMLGLSLMGAISGGQQYMDSREFGDSASWSQVTAGLNAAAEILGEKLGFEKLLTVGEDVAKKEIKKAVFDGLKAWGLDVGGELLTTVAQDLVSKMSDRPNLTTKELQDDVVDTFWSTLFMGPMQTAIVGGMGGVKAAVTKSDVGPLNMKEHIEQNFEGSKVDLTGHGANITLPSGRVVEVHDSTSPMVDELKKSVDEGAKKRGIDTATTAISGVYFRSGLLVGTENDLIYLTGQMTDPTTLPHEKGHLIIEVMRDMMFPGELEAIGIPAKGVIDNDLEESVMKTFEEYAYKRTPSLTNPMSPLDKAYQNVIDFAHEIYTAFGGATTQRQVFEDMRTGRILQREGAVRLPGESDAAFQVRTIRPEWHEDDVKTRSGQIVGAPGSHLSHQAREGLIRKMVRVATGMNKVNPEQAQWYELAGNDVRRLFGITQAADGTWQGNMDGADQFLRAVAQWSIQADVGRNTDDAVNVIHQIARGEEARTSGVMTNAATMAQRFVDNMAASEVTSDLAGLGPKAVSFYWDLHNAVYKVRDAVNTTIDRHIIGAWDLASRTGRPMESLKGPQYRWANNVMREVMARFNAENGTDLDPRNVQALLWAWQRGGRVFEKGAVDHIGSHLGVGIVTGEIVPATNSDVTPWIHEQNFDTKKALSDHVIKAALYDESGRNVILARLQVPQGGMVQGTGTFEGAVNPNVISTMVLQDFSPDLANLYADLFGYIFTQNAVPWYRADRNLNGVEGKTQGYAVVRRDGPITGSLVRSFYDILKTKIPSAELTFLGDEVHVVNFMGLDQTEFHAKIQEVADGWAKENDINSGHWQFGTEGDYRQGDADGAERWTGQEYVSRILAAGSPALFEWADSQRKAAVDAAREFSQEVAPPGAKFQAKDRISSRTTLIYDINDKDITPAVRVAAMSESSPVSRILPQDRAWLLPDGGAIFLEGYEVHEQRAGRIVNLAGINRDRVTNEMFGGATGAIRAHGFQRDFRPGWDDPARQSINIEVFSPLSDKQVSILAGSLGANRPILADVSDPKTGVNIGYAYGKGAEGLAALQSAAKKAYGPGAKLQTKPMVTTKDGEFPADHNGWKFQGEMMGYYQYTLADPNRPDFTPTLLVDKPENLQKKIDLTLAKFEGPKMQTRTPGPKGLTVNFTSPEVNAIGEELLRGAFEKLQFTTTNDKSLKNAQDLIKAGKMGLNTFLNHDPYTAWPDTAHQVAAESIAGGVFQYVKDQIAEYKAGRITADEANRSRMIGMASIAAWYLPQSEVGRMLQARQIAISPEGIPIKDLMDEQMRFEKDLQELKDRGLVDDDQILDAMDQFYSVDQAQNFARRVAAKKVGDISILNQLFYFSLLSNPVTQSANLIGNLGPVFFSIAEQYLSEKIPYGATPKGGAEGMAAGLYHGLLDAFVLAGRAAQTGESSFGGSKFRAQSPTGVQTVDQARAAMDQIMADKTHPFHDPPSPQYPAAKRDVARLHRLGSNAISGERFSRLSSGAIDANGSMGRVIDLLGSITDSPFKGLAAGDEFFKVIAYRMSIYKSAYQLAATQGLEGDAFDTSVATFVENPTSSADAEAKAFAMKQTFTNEMGEIGQFLQKMSNKEAVGPIVKFFIPFVKITTNLGLYSVERVPLLNLVLKQVRDDMAAGGTKRDAAIAKTVSGGALMLTFAGLAMAGMVTGGGPADPKLKALWSQPDENGNVAWQEYSLKINGKWVSYKRIEPFATMIGISADMVEVSRAFNVDVGEMFMVGALAGIRNMTSKTWMIGISNLIETLTSGGPEDLGRNTKRLARQLPSLLIPGGVAQASRVVDPTKRDVQSWMDVIKSRIPGLSAQLEPKYTLKGDPVTVQMYDSMPGKGFGMINPILYTGNSKDPVSLELVRNRIPITMPSRRLGGGPSPDASNLEGKDTGIDLTPEQYGWFVKMAGNGLKDPKTGRGAWDELTAIITGDIPADYKYEKGKKPEALYYNQKNPDGTPVFSDGPQGGKAFIITQVLLAARSDVRKMIESGEAFPEVGAQYEEKKMRKEVRQAPQVGGAR